METALDYVTRLWPVAVAFVGIVAWLVKVDGRTVQNANNLAKLETRLDAQRKEDMDRISRAVEAMTQEIRTVQADIKTLLRRGAE